jgi:hypothetical protein
MEISNLDELKELAKMLEKPQPIELPLSNFMAQIWYYIGCGKKIHAIKVLRSNSDHDLKACKKRIEDMMAAAERFNDHN